MYNIFIENPEQLKDIESEIAKFRAKIVAKNIDSLGLNSTQIKAILNRNAICRNARGLWNFQPAFAFKARAEFKREELYGR